MRRIWTGDEVGNDQGEHFGVTEQVSQAALKKSSGSQGRQDMARAYQGFNNGLWKF